MKNVFESFRAAIVCCLIGAGVMLTSINTSQAQDTSLEERLASIPSHIAPDVRKHFADFAKSARPPDKRAQPLPRPVPANSEWLTATGITESVAASARCAIGYVVQGSHRASAEDIVIVSEELVDCDADGCRAFQVVAKRDSTDPFDLDVSVTCSE